MSTTPAFLLFMHIPKTAGTTLRTVVDTQYGREAVLTYYNQPTSQMLDNLPYMLMAKPGAYRALIGHFRFGLHKTLGQPSRYVTLLRDPVRRAVSEYFERRKTTATRLEMTKSDGTVMSLDEALDRYPELYANQQVKYVAGVPPGLAAHEDHLEQARRNITEHFIAGVTERFDESLAMLSRALGWAPFSYERKNVGDTEASPSTASALARLAALNALDRQLYDFVAARLARDASCP